MLTTRPLGYRTSKAFQRHRMKQACPSSHTSGEWHKIGVSQELSDMLVEELAKSSKED